MVEIKKVEVDGEVVHLSKTNKYLFARWHVIYPIKNDDGSINWKHLITGGTWGNLIFALLFVLVFLGAAWEYNSNLKECTQAMEKLNFIESINNTISINPLLNKLRLNPNITLEVNLTE